MSGCAGCNDDCFDGGVQLSQGPTGTDGTDGLYGGWALKWEYDSGTANTTGSGEVRFNNATLASVTHIFINDTASEGVDVSSFLASVGTTPFGRIKIFKEDDSSIYWLGEITAADAAAVPAEYDLTVTHVVSNGAFTDEDDVVVCLMPDGDTGPTGGTGGTGAAGIGLLSHILAAATPTSSNSFVLGTGAITVDADTLADNQDTLRYECAVIGTTASNHHTHGLQIKFGPAGAGTALEIGVAGSTDINEGRTQGYRVVVDITRVNNTTVRIEAAVEVFYHGDYTQDFLYAPNAGAIIAPSDTYIRSGQTIGGLTLDSTAYTVETFIKTNSVVGSSPIKVIKSDLIFLNYTS